MKLLGIIAAIALLLVSTTSAEAQAASAVSPGDIFEFTRTYRTSERSSDGASSSSSSGSDAIVERVISMRDGVVVSEYDMSEDAKAEDRSRQWHLPARIAKPTGAPMRLLNAEELEARLQTWMAAAGLDRSACGRWYFTWNAFKVDCDPQSIVETIKIYDLSLESIQEGGAYLSPQAIAPGLITRAATRPDGATFVTELKLNPAAVHRERAEADVVVAEIMQKPVALDAALAERVKEQVSGTISLTFDSDAWGTVIRRTKVTKLESKPVDGPMESRTATETVERRLISTTSSQR